MRIALLVSLTLLVSCEKPAPDASTDQALIKRLQNAPKNSILVGWVDTKYSSSEPRYYEVVCGHNGDFIEVARVGVWRCSSSDSKTVGKGTVTARRLVTNNELSNLIEPGDADYDYMVQKLSPFR